MKLTQKQETFCLKYFELGNASEAARIAKYSPKTAPFIGAENLLKPKIQARIRELRDKVECESVANVLERKQRLTIFLREDNYNKFGINRQSNIAASDQLNKMDKLYTDGATLNVDNRTVNINVDSEKAKELTERLIEGERTGAT